MRPLSLGIKNLTSLKSPGPIDFTDLDLFAIWGPTGAGKSSLVDAITFALFGQIPRVGKNVRELISQNEDRMSVAFEFSSDGSQYRIHRGTSRKGTSPVQLERLGTGDDEWETIADRATEVTAEIEKILRMDYQAFVRSVLLPQGEFDRFLAGDRDERRKVIDGLLRLGVYAEMHRRANAMDADATRDANVIRDRLDTELSEATPVTLKSAKADLKRLEVRARELKNNRQKAFAAESAARRLTEATERDTAARIALIATQKDIDAASKLLATGEATLKDFDTRLTALQNEAKATNYDAAAHLLLSQCLPLLQNLELLAAQEKRLFSELEASASVLEKLRKESEAVVAKDEAAMLDAKAKRDEFTQAQRSNAASFLVQDLKPGDPCPICGQAIGEVKHTVHKDFSRIKAASEAAQEAELKAREAVNAAQRSVALKEQESGDATKRLATLRGDITTRQAAVDELLPEQKVSAADIESRIAFLEAAKDRSDKLEAEQLELRSVREKTASELTRAKTDFARLETMAKGYGEEIAKAAQDASGAASDLDSTAKVLEWIDVVAALHAGRDPAPLIPRRLRDLQDEDAGVQREIGGQKARIEQIERDIIRAKDLRDREKILRETASLAKDLASLLRTNNFPTFIREQALRALAEDGTRRLNEVSKGRFDFEVDGQDFYVLDRWNGGERRSVNTLSGGETFLASLALALALAEQLPGLAGDTTGGALETLFIDEGFSHLDNETLDDVASALEVLGQDRRRLVGVITHLPALAERMPARITVHKSPAGSTVTVD